jgi:hypothetical protein
MTSASVTVSPVSLTNVKGPPIATELPAIRVWRHIAKRSLADLSVVRTKSAANITTKIAALMVAWTRFIGASNGDCATLNGADALSICSALFGNQKRASK